MLLPQALLDQLDHYTVDTLTPVGLPDGGQTRASRFKLCFKPWWKWGKKIEISCISTIKGDVTTFHISPDAVELADQLREWALATVGAREAMEQSQSLLRSLAARR